MQIVFHAIVLFRIASSDASSAIEHHDADRLERKSTDIENASCSTKPSHGHNYSRLLPATNIVVKARSVPAVNFAILGLNLSKIKPLALDVEKSTISMKELSCGADVGYAGSVNWQCVRPAPLRASWPNKEFGFTDAEHAGMVSADMCSGEGSGAPRAYETEASSKRRNQRRPPAISRSPMGFHIVRMPKKLLQVLRAVYTKGNRTTEEHHTKYCQSNHLFKENGAQWKIISLGDPAAMKEVDFKTGTKGEMGLVRAWIVAVLQQMVESWQGRSRELQVVHFYGLRQYESEAMMINHRDAFNRVLGVLMQIDQDIDEGWPLYIEDMSRGPSNEPEYHEVFLQPGTMIFYEAARITHGRPRRLQGRTFTNAFLHFMPKAKT